MSEKLQYTHDNMIDLMIANPRVTQREIASRFGYTEGWISQVVRSDGFRELYEKRRKELVDPTMLAHIENRLEALAARSMDVIQEALDTNANPEIALQALAISTRAMGYGAGKAGLTVNQQFVVAMPSKGVDSESWAKEHTPVVING